MAELAVRVTICVLFTALVVTANVPLLWPAVIVMLAGTVAAALLLLSVTSTPLAPAGAGRVTVPVEGDPPVTVFGNTLTPVMVPRPGPAGLIVSMAFPWLAEVAVRVTVCVLFTALVVTAKVPLLWPAAMVMLTGTVAATLLLLSVTSTPPAPAAADNVTVPVEGDPPVTTFGDTLTPVMVP